MYDNRQRIVRFDMYCHSCKHLTTSENEDPCDECLTYPVNEDSEKPVNYEEAKE